MSIEVKAHAEGVFQGKVLSFLDQWKGFSESWVAHVASDDKNIKEVRDEIAKIKEEIARTAKAEDVADFKAVMMRYAGGAGVVITLTGILIPIIIQQLLK